VWSSSDPDIATVTYDPHDPTNTAKNGKITGVTPGVVEIRAEQGEVKDKCIVTVKVKPPKLPHAVIVPGTNPRFTLDWEQGDTYSETEAVAAVKQVMDTWLAYKASLDPLPFYDTGGVPNFAVFISSGGKWQLDNSDPTANGPIVIHRYWPPGMSPDTVQTWRSNAYHDIRVQAFKDAVAEIQGMRAAIQGSPLYTLADPGGGSKTPLQTVYESMGAHIDYNPPTCTTRTEFTLSVGTGNKIAIINPSVTGTLYEYYLGYVPAYGYGDNDYKNSTPLAFPE
jgi:hypothetical protein